MDPEPGSEHSSDVVKGSASDNLRRFQLSINPGVSLKFSDLTAEDESAGPAPSEADAVKCQAVGKTIRAYLKAARELLGGQYADLKPHAPIHLSSECWPTVVICQDGILVRYEEPADLAKSVRVCLVASTLAELAPILSDSVIHCPSDPKDFVPASTGVTFGLVGQNAATGEQIPIMQAQIALIVSLPSDSAPTGQVDFGRPRALASVHRQIELMLEGITEPGTSPQGPRSPQKFLVRSRLNLPVIWQAIEVFPPFDASVWRPDVAAAWAESDLLAYATRRNLREDQLRALDPNQPSRAQFGSLLSQLQSLLSGPEEPVHQFLKEHPQLLSPTYTRYWSKLPIGQHVTDFVFQEAGSNYLLVELEAPARLLFRDDGQPREDLTHALNQVTDWQRYIEDNLRTVQDELGLEGLSSNPRFLIVIGRSASLTDATKRKLVTMHNQNPKVSIMTYDDLLAHAKSVVENILGPLWEVGENVSIYYYPK
jgi:hypothetical protein